MENNNQNPANAQDVTNVPSLSNILEGTVEGQDNILDNITNPENGNPPAEGATPPANDPPAGTPPANTPATPPNQAVPAEGDNSVLALITGDPSSLSADNADFRNTLMDLFGANSADANGNLLNVNGEVVLSYENLNDYIETGNLNLDAQGNLINDLGQIVRQADDLAPAPSFVDELLPTMESDFGFKFLDEQNKPKVYDNSLDGRKSFIKDVVNNTYASAVSSFLDANPTIKNVFYHLSNNGDLSNFVENAVDYSAIDVNTLSTDQKMSYIRQAYEKQGIKNSASLIGLIEKAGDEQVTQSAAEAILSLRDIAEEKVKADELAYKAKEVEDAKNAQAYWNNVQSVITNGKLKDIQISADEKSDFYKYIAMPIDAKGNTQESIDAQKEDIEFSLLTSYLRYKKYDISKLVKERAGVSKLDRLRERMPNANPRIENTNQRVDEQGGNARQGNFAPSIEQLLG